MGKWLILGLLAICGAGCNQSTGLEPAGVEKTPVSNVLDQGNSRNDTEITQKIRKSIVVEPGKDEHSVAGKNIQIVTRNGEVSLSGTVRSEKEKLDIQKRAEDIAGESSVRNLLVVEPEKP